MKANTYLIINRYLKSRTSYRRPYVTLACDCGCALRKNTKPRVDDEEEEVPIKKRGPYGTKKSGCPFKLKCKQMATSENWQLFVHDGRHNHKVVVYNHGHAQTARLMEEQLKQTEQFRKSHVPHNILTFFREQNISCAVSAQKYTMLLPRLRRTRVWTSEVLNFGVETTNSAESEHSMLKLWLSTCHGDLDTVFLNIDSLIKGQITEIKSSLEIHKLKEKYDVKSNLILKNISNNISHLALRRYGLR
ncbi:hypothetical protein M9H77_33840 [Catharanthus roseus]|uniref:Uncharacterized protein n=1 Tax=Catharanthus roseus TaxID=4058 RepID=A0ACB9ZKA0_CATRO|nr:hypothetical protein M9H77_33840 [Catharanthus roseus]